MKELCKVSYTSSPVCKLLMMQSIIEDVQSASEEYQAQDFKLTLMIYLLIKNSQRTAKLLIEYYYINAFIPEDMQGNIILEAVSDLIGALEQIYQGHVYERIIEKLKDETCSKNKDSNSVFSASFVFEEEAPNLEGDRKRSAWLSQRRPSDNRKQLAMTMNELLNQPAKGPDNLTINVRSTAAFGEEAKIIEPTTPKLQPTEFNYDTPSDEEDHFEH